jgi:hypothetical protein
MAYQGNPFAIDMGGKMIAQGLGTLGKGLGVSNQRQEQERKLEEQKAVMGQFFDASDSGDFESQNRLMRENPIMMKQFAQINSLGDARKDKLKNEMAGKVISEGWKAQDLVERYGEQANAIGMGKDMESLSQATPEQLRQVASQSWMGSDEHKRWVMSQDSRELTSTQKKVMSEGIDPNTPEGQARARELHQGARTDPSLRTDQQVIDKANDAQLQAAGFANRVKIANADLSALEATPGFDPATVSSTIAGESTVGNLILDENQQLYKRGKADFITSVLRRESGAAIGADEFAREDVKYFPQIGDSKKVIERKQRARANAFNNLSKQSKGVYDVQFGLPKGLPKDTMDNGNGTYTLPSGQIIKPKA